MDRKWWKEAVVYQIYPRSFKDSNGDGVGDIRGIIEKVDYLKLLGIDVVWLSPVYSSPNDDNGYDVSDYQDIMTEFGTMEDLDELIEKLHDAGIKLMMDLVVNHSSDEHRWFEEAKKSKDNPYRDYYIWRDPVNGKEPTNWESFFSGSVWEYSEETEQYYMHLFTKKQPDLNWENEKVRFEVYKMMNWWLDKGIDGFRMDVINLISKHYPLTDGMNAEGKKFVFSGDQFMNGPKIHEFLQEMNREVLQGRDVITVGETPGVSVEQARNYTGEDRNELQMVFQFEHMGLDSYGSKWDIKPLQLVELKENLSKWQYGLDQVGWNSLYLNNHDQPRMVSRYGDDQNYRVESAKMLATMLHTMKGTPYIYQGEELGMTNVKFDSLSDYKDVESLNMYKDKVEQGASHEDLMHSIHVKGRDNARTPIQWNNEEHGGFTKGKPWIKVNDNYPLINAEAAIKDKDSVFHYYKQLIELRKENPIMVYGRYELLLPEHESVFAYTRTYENEKWIILLNFSGESNEVILDELVDSSNFKTVIGNYSRNEVNRELILKPYEALVLSV